MDFQNSYLPMGIAAVNLLGERSGNANHSLTEAEKEELIFKYKDADSEEERERIIDSLPPEEDAKSLFGGPSIG